MNKSNLLKTAAALALLAATSVFAQAVNSNTSDVTLNASVGESLTVTINSGNTVNFGQLTPGSSATTNVGDVAISITTAWNLISPTSNSVKLYAYFSTPVQAMANGTSYIPASDIYATVNSGIAAALNGSFAVGTPLDSTTITSGNLQGTMNDSVTLGIDLTGFTNMNLPAGNYTGTLHIQAQAAS